jgi:orotidine 5'-phosphate decarboxylase subfamily 2
VDVLGRLIREVPEGIPVLLDAKRGDISTTAEAYATAAYAVLGADAVTINAYMGADSVAPFAGDARRGVFVLCKTSNASADELQRLAVRPPLTAAAGGRAGASTTLFEHVARVATTTWNKQHNVGLVVGATDVQALAAVRAAAAPGTWILAPGVGFQGGDLHTALSAGLRPDGSGVLLPVSRGISRAADPAEAALQLRDAINAVRASVRAAAAAAPPAVAGGTAQPLQAHQRDFIASALSAGVLRFGSFTLKSGRQSPYFFNAGNFRTGAALAALGRTYAAAVVSAGVQFDVLFGPAYKGIPLVTTTAVALADAGVDVPVAYNRKEAKDHGEGGLMVGADVGGKRVLIVDDVISAGTAVGEAIAIIKAAGGVPAGVVIGLDRQEKGSGGVATSAVQQVREAYGIPVVAVATLAHLIAFIQEAASAGGGAVPGLEGITLAELLAAVRAYRAEYGVDDATA